MEERAGSGLNDDTDISDSEYSRVFDDDDGLGVKVAQMPKGWNLFREIPVKQDTGSMASTAFFDACVKGMKVLAYVITFVLVLASAVASKGTLLFITSQLKKDRPITHCNKVLDLDSKLMTVNSLEERIAWLWAALIVFSAPEIGLFLRSARICFFKTVRKPKCGHFIIVWSIETLQAIGTALLMLIILPDLDSVKGVMLMNALCLMPAVLNCLTRDSKLPWYYFKIGLDVLAILSQLTALVVWPVMYNSATLWCIPVATIFVSFGWWENFVNYDEKATSVTKIYLTNLRMELKLTRYYSQQFLTLWKIIVFICCIMVALAVQGDDAFSFFTNFNDAFGLRNYTVQEITMVMETAHEGLTNYLPTGATFDLPAVTQTPIWVALIQVFSGYICYITAKFACKILIQRFSFTYALSLVGPVTVMLLILFCGLRSSNDCEFHGIIPDYLFFNMPPVHYPDVFIFHQMSWIWLLWLASQVWVTIHTWYPKCERLAATDKLFCKPWYSGVFVDQCLLMNRSKDSDFDISVEELKNADEESNGPNSIVGDNNVNPSGHVPRVFVCATMWHETRDEMMEFLKSIFRMDEDQSARRVAQKYLGYVDPDYYEMETHIFMDDAFEVSDHSMTDFQVNRFVKCLVNTVNEAASEVHLTNLVLRPPKKVPTPYGGKLVWILPGKSKMICHLKDKGKIRHRKRWSQVMYMYYFLGHRLMDLPISVEQKEVLANNTYLLALDGDIDFKPAAVTLLLDLMKKDNNLGAACGRIHPVGSGFMAWYQMFEYAIGHWLQKATEHMIGCVLCSPGCFSLFRGKALMDDNVMRKYTLTSHEARHFVQYDQGEDRWLCTLLLQRGYRVEYSAASDAYTHCPERFDEFFNQRRRWIPSTMANVLDLLVDYKRTVKVNDNISTIYIFYQILLMVGTLLGPGTIFLMLVGAMNTITGISMFNALLWNLVPIAAFLIICLTCKSSVQLLVAHIITCIYACLMMMVIIGIALQIFEDGWLAPSSIFTVVTFGIFFVTAALHPQEANCLLYIVIYYITIPSMYILLIIYSVCNVHVVTWGTREIAEKKTLKEREEQKQREEAKNKSEGQDLLKWLPKSNEDSGSIELGIAGLFRCLCCTNPNDHKGDIHLMHISNSLEKIGSRLDQLGAQEEVEVINIRRRTSMGLRKATLHVLPECSESDLSTDDIAKDERDELVNPYWIEDESLQNGEVDFLTTAETEFWKDLIDTYLEPIDENKDEQELLHNISGEFRSGELTCILGPSGAGKSSLLNILAGYASNGVNGRISVNGQARDMRVFKKLSSYIMQDDLLQPRLTVHEAMRIAADLKLGDELGRADKVLVVEEILQTLGLWDHRDTRSECLSGGQLKRLSIALELVNNPPIIFLDEPTTGLDVVSIRHLVVLLRLLSRQGRSIICTIHQPSASLFALFDRVYVLAKGLCCYQGAPPLLIPYLSEVGHECPTTHNPADFVLETLMIDFEAPAKMSELCQNGKLCRKLDRITARGGRRPVLHSDESIQRIFGEHVAKEQQQKMEFPTTFLTQFLILTRRMFVQTKRNSTTLWIQLAHHVVTAVLLGGLFFAVGNNGDTPIVNFKFCLSVLVFFMYTYVMVPVLLFPMEVRVLRREYFNRWYSLKAYYAALTFSSLPVMVTLGLLFLAICYLMSGQLLQWDRFVLFAFIGILTGLCSEGLGLLVGSAFNVTNGSIVGPATFSPLLVLCCYGMGFGPYIENFMKVLMSASYLRYGLTGFSLALYEHRPLMDCSEIYCHYADPVILLRDLGMANDSYGIQVAGLLVFTVIHRVMAYFTLRYRLTQEFSSKFMTYISKYLKHR